MSSFLVLLGLARKRSADVDAERSGELGGAITNGAGYGVIPRDGSEQLAGLAALALFGERHRGHFAGTAKPRLARLGEGLKPGDHVLRLELVELERRLPDEGCVAVRLRKSAILGGRLESGGRCLDVALLDREVSASEHRGSADRLAAALRQLIELFRCLATVV